MEPRTESIPTSFKETTRKQAEFRRQKAPFSKLKTDREKFDFLSRAEPFAREFLLLQGKGGYAWWPTLAGIPIFNEDWPAGFTTPEQAYALAIVEKAKMAAALATMPQ